MKAPHILALSATILFSLLTSTLLASTVEVFTNFVEITPPMQSSTTFMVSDDKFGDPIEQAKIEMTHSIKNRVIFEVDESSLRTLPDTAQMYTLTYYLTTWNADGSDSTTTMHSLALYYDPNTDRSTAFQAFYSFTDAPRFSVQVESILSDQVNEYPDFRIFGEIIINRSYLFNCAEAPFFSRPGSSLPAVWYLDQAKAVNTSWEHFNGYEEYDLEWAFYDAESEVGEYIPNNWPANFDLNTLFENNATRITTDMSSYTVRTLYPSGHLFFRLRAVRYTFDGLREVSAWSTLNEVPTTYNGIVTIPWFEESINWQASTVYAEEGKNKPSINFFDGSLRSRQNATTLGDNKIISQTLYDHYGRPVLQSLPAPSSISGILKFEPAFMREVGQVLPGQDPTPYGLDKTSYLINSSIDVPDPLSDLSGVGRYYSSELLAPLDHLDKDHFVPDAEGYPFSMTQYTADQTGRILRQSGVGEAFKMGSGHETRYFYGKPDQVEIDRLFGNDVGSFEHYLKNMVMDPNGQLSISYVDAHGRTIATALAGNKPTVVEELDNYTTPENITINLLSNLNNTLTSTYTLLVEGESEHDITYTLQPLNYQPSCTGASEICYECYYELEITISDNDCNSFNDGEPLVITATNTPIGSAIEYPVDCTALGLDEAILKALPIGQYEITKILTLNTSAAEVYANHYVQQANCIPTYEQILNELISEIPSGNCDPANCLQGIETLEAYLDQFAQDLGLVDRSELTVNQTAVGELEYQQIITDCEAMNGPDDCAIYEQLLSTDMIPQETIVNPGIGEDGCPLHPATGQYALYAIENGGVNPADTESIFSDQSDWYYVNMDFGSILVINNAGESVSPSMLSPIEFIELFDLDWLEIMVTYHPEYCFVERCREDNSRDFDNQLRNTNSLAEAINAGLVDAQGIIYTFDPFFQLGGQGEGTSCLQQMQEYYAHIVPGNTDSPSLLDWISEIVYGYGNGICTTYFNQGTSAENDQAWIRLRGYYLGVKEKIRQQKYADLCLNFCPVVLTLENTCEYIQSSPFIQRLSVQNFENIGSFSFEIDYDQQELAVQGVTGVGVTAFSFMNNPVLGIITITSNAGAGPWTLADGATLLEISYTYVGNSLQTEVNFASTPAPQVTNEQDSVLNATWVNGTVFSFSNCPSTAPPPQNTCCKVSRLRTNLDPDLAITSLQEAHDLMNEAEEEAAALISDQCAQYRTLWEADIRAAAVCQQVNQAMLNNAMEGLLDRLEAVCAIGGDVNHPFGASSTPFEIVNGETRRVLINGTDYSFAQILTDFSNGNPGINLGACNDYHEYIITYPGPWELQTYSGGRTIQSKANSCACDQLKTLRNCYNANNEGYATFDEYLAQYSNENLSVENRTMLENACTTMVVSEQSRYLEQPISLPPYLDCDVCQTCDDIQPLYTAAQQAYTGEAPWNFIADYLNYHLAFQLSKEEYQDFFAECGKGSINCREATMLCPKLPFDGTPTPLSDCEEQAMQEAEIQALIIYNAQLEEYRQEFINNYLTYCTDNTQETFTAETQLHEYHYTLYYYDQAGNLSRTVPPKGVQPIADPNLLQQIIDHRADDVIQPEYPDHKMPTAYQYNSLRQLITKQMPDTEPEYFWYDEIGRLVASQDGRQLDVDSDVWYSYTFYNDLGRVIEIGEATNIQLNDYLQISKNSGEFRVNYEELVTLINYSVGLERKFITRTYYDTSKFPISAFGSAGQENLRNRVASVTFSEFYPTITPADDEYDYGTHYSYDITGNVKTLVQELRPLANAGHDLKRIDYDYDFLSGNVNAVYYQRGQADQFTHRYQYDSDNRLTHVYTSAVYTDEPLEAPLWERDATYDYYQHGPLARTLLGQRQVQGCDYAYTLQGWIKGLNASSLEPNRDMGRDGGSTAIASQIGTSPNALVARDAFAYTLGYFDGDFSAVGADDARFELATSSTAFNAGRDLHNGNIRHMVAESMGLTGGLSGNLYAYDQLHRIKQMNSYSLSPEVGSYTWSSNLASMGNESNYSYDPNGNLQQLQRRAGGVLMDDLTYIYEGHDDNNPNTELYTDRLRGVRDLAQTGQGQFEEDFQSQINNNYEYDGAGNIKRDNQSSATINWTPYGKVHNVAFDGLAPPDQNYFEYGPDQNRVAKIYSKGATIRSTYYIRDAQGNCLATYDRNGNIITWKEQHLYGSSRLGLWQPNVSWNGPAPPSPHFLDEAELQEGQKSYELGNHLGNVTSVITDRKQGIDEGSDNEYDYFDPIVRAATEYYPFGLAIPNRSSNFNSYRFGFNGKEKDDDGEWGELTHYDYGFRIYNPSIARFLSVDPLAPDYPWYTPYQFAGNMPIMAVDLDGLEQFIVVQWKENKQIKSEITVVVKESDTGFGAVYLPSDDPKLRVKYINRETNEVSYSSTLRDEEYEAIRSVTDQHTTTNELGTETVRAGTYTAYLSENIPDPAPPVVKPDPDPPPPTVIRRPRRRPPPAGSTRPPVPAVRPRRRRPPPPTPRTMRLDLTDVAFDGNEAEIDRGGGSWEWGSDDITDLLEPAVQILQNNPTAELELFIGTKQRPRWKLIRGPYKGKPIEVLLKARYNEVVRQLKLVDPDIDVGRVKYFPQYRTRIGFKGNVKYRE